MANIRTARRSGLVLRGGRNVRETRWLQTPTSTITIGTAATAVLAFTLDAAALALLPFTIIRERNFWFVRPDVTSGGEFYGGAVGAAVVSEQASAIGVTAVPTPLTDQGSDLWYMYAQLFGRFGGTQVEDVGKTMQIDSRAMRKVEDGQDVIIVLESGAATEAASMVSVFGGRFLVKLH